MNVSIRDNVDAFIKKWNYYHDIDQHFQLVDILDGEFTLIVGSWSSGKTAFEFTMIEDVEFFIKNYETIIKMGIKKEESVDSILNRMKNITGNG